MPNDHPTQLPTQSVNPSRQPVRSVRHSRQAAEPALHTHGAEVESPASFGRLNLSPSLLQSAQRLGYIRPTPIQLAAIPLLLAGRDLLASAATGSGKTAAFLFPILQLLQDRPRGSTRALVLTPTRELAAQILDHFRALSAGTGLRAEAVYGGVSHAPQTRAFRTGTDVIIATPGRLLDHFQHSYAKLSGLEFLVLDEADRMLDMGFLPDIRRILTHLPRKRQTLLFSATLPAPIVDLAQRMLRDPAAVHIEPKPVPARGITHCAYAVPPELKARLLLEILKLEAPARVLAFTRTRHRANRLADFLDRHSVPCGRIHGNRSQAQRTEALAGFRKGRFQVLVATDIAARGLDVAALDLVVNFDVPGAAEDYIHRVGRTARAEATGNAYTLVAPEDEGGLRAIERGIGRRIPRKTLPGFNYRRKFEGPPAEGLETTRTRKPEERSRPCAKAPRGSNEAKRAGQSKEPAGRKGKTLPNRTARRGVSSRRSGPAVNRSASRVSAGRT